MPSAGHAVSSDAGTDGKAPDSLFIVRFLGPERSIAALCGPKCRVVRTLPVITPFRKVVLAVGSDPLNTQNVHVKSTHILFKTDDGWYGAVILRVGKGIQDVEMFNPPDAGMPDFGHMRRDVVYSGKISRVRTIEDQTTKQKLVALELTRSDGVPLEVLLLCGADRYGGPACGELQSETSLAGYTVKDGVVNVTWQGGESEQFAVFPRDE